MASASLAPYKNNSAQVTHLLVATGPTGSSYSVAGRSLGLPYGIQIQRKVGPSGSLANDHVIVKVGCSYANATTGKIATGSVSCDISIPRDSTIITTTVMAELLGQLSSLLNDSTALAATSANRVALIEGRDL